MTTLPLTPTTAPHPARQLAGLLLGAAVVLGAGTAQAQARAHQTTGRAKVQAGGVTAGDASCQAACA